LTATAQQLTRRQFAIVVFASNVLKTLIAALMERAALVNASVMPTTTVMFVSTIAPEQKPATIVGPVHHRQMTLRQHALASPIVLVQIAKNVVPSTLRVMFAQTMALVKIRPPARVISGFPVMLASTLVQKILLETFAQATAPAVSNAPIPNASATAMLAMDRPRAVHSSARRDAVLRAEPVILQKHQQRVFARPATEELIAQ
jgi:hypothetical protein